MDIGLMLSIFDVPLSLLFFQCCFFKHTPLFRLHSFVRLISIFCTTPLQPPYRPILMFLGTKEIMF